MSLLADIKQYKNKSWASTRKPSLAFRDIGWAVGLAGTCLGFICFGMSSGDASAASITVSITDSSADLNLVATEGGVAYGESDTASFSVSTTSSGGYTATITGGNSTGRLTGTDSNNYFTSISSAIASPSDFNNGTWGFKPSTYNSSSNTSYRPVATSSSPATIDVTNSATTGNYTLAVAAKTDTGTAADTYSYNFVVAATSNAIDYDIAFVNPADNMPARMTSSTTGSTVTLPSSTPTMSGYIFAGWCTVSVSPGSACTGTTYAAGATYSLNSGSNNDVTLYALWEASACPPGQQYVMQNISTWKNSLTTGTSVTACDARDNNLYKVAKLADGKVWMQDNLAFNGKDNQGSGSYITMNNSNTNVASGSNVTWNDTVRTGWTSSSQNSFDTQYINDAYKNTVPSDSTSQSGGYKIGVYYNYAAATAGTITGNVNFSPASYDVCPQGWRLPTGGGSGEFQTLYSNSNYNTYANYRSALRLPLSGFFYPGWSYDDRGSYGYWWSATMPTGTDRFNMVISASDITPVDHTDRRRGFSIRCIAK